ALHERIFDRLPEAARDAEKLCRLECLVAEEDDEMRDQGGANRRDVLAAHVVRKVDAENLRADRAGERADVERVRCHGGKSNATAPASLAPPEAVEHGAAQERECALLQAAAPRVDGADRLDRPLHEQAA